MNNPIKTVVQPESELSNDMIIGISAPPMGRINKNPKREDKKVMNSRLGRDKLGVK